MNYGYKQLSQDDTKPLKDLLKLFGEAFGEIDTYIGHMPNDSYLKSLLSKPHFIALVAICNDEIVGGIAAYELEKFEQDRREIYIYDLAVSENHRRKGVATQLIKNLTQIAQERKAYMIFVQADKQDVAAIALYESFGTKADVLHFDIPVKINPKIIYKYKNN